MSHEKSMDEFGNSASDLIRRMESRDYIARYQISSDGKNVKSIFFMHSSAAVEINVRGEVFGIDATYKVNNKAMLLVLIQSVSHLGGKSLMTTPIAYAIVSDDSAETYTWILEHIKKLTEDKKPVFISDKALFVMKALKTVFPDSAHLLCTWHMLQNFKTTLANVFVNPTDKTSCMVFVNDMINSSSEKKFQIALDNYRKYATDVRKLTYSGKYKTINEKVKSTFLSLFEFFSNLNPFTTV